MCYVLVAFISFFTMINKTTFCKHIALIDNFRSQQHTATLMICKALQLERKSDEMCQFGTYIVESVIELLASHFDKSNAAKKYINEYLYGVLYKVTSVDLSTPESLYDVLRKYAIDRKSIVKRICNYRNRTRGCYMTVYTPPIAYTGLCTYTGSTYTGTTL